MGEHLWGKNDFATNISFNISSEFFPLFYNLPTIRPFNSVQ